MVERQSLKQLRLTAPDIRHLLNVYVDGDAQEDIEDVARLLCLYLCHTLLFPTGTTVKWVYLERVEDLEKLNGYNWCAAIVNELLASIHKHHHQPKKVSGCVMVLLYWLCEHTNLVDSQFPNATPAFVKWSIPSLTRKFNTVSFKNLNRTQVVTGLPNVMVPSSLEILINVVCAEENQTVSNAALQCNKSILPSSSSHENESHETTRVDNCNPYRPTQSGSYKCSSCVWWGGDSGSCVFVEDFKQLILDSSISGFVIDAYTTILMREQLNRRFELQNKGTQMANESSYAFKSSCLLLIVRKSPEEWLELLKKWLPKACGFRYLHFPFTKVIIGHCLCLTLNGGVGSFITPV